jgi:acyl dehydratase
VSALISYDDVAAGTQLPTQRIPITRLDLVKYCGASGDFNYIHWNERFAASVGLPDVIAHGMHTMGKAVRVVTDWCGDPGAVVEYGVRFAAMVVVPNDGLGAALDVSAVVTEKRPDDKTVVVEIDARVDGTKVLSRARAVVRLP